MVGTMPVILAVGATLFAHERMDRTGWFALAVSTLGATLIAFSTHGTAARHATSIQPAPPSPATCSSSSPWSSPSPGSSSTSA